MGRQRRRTTTAATAPPPAETRLDVKGKNEHSYYNSPSLGERRSRNATVRRDLICPRGWLAVRVFAGDDDFLDVFFLLQGNHEEEKSWKKRMTPGGSRLPSSRPPPFFRGTSQGH
jgi:hypothetical protein